jgi:microcin C transport system substrate-binding protein
MMRLVKFRLPSAAWTISCASATRQAATRAAPALAAALLGAMSLAFTPAHAASAIAQYDQPKYPANFTHFDYADPDAPNTGDLNFENYSELQSYDSLNPFLVRGAPAPDIQNLMFDTLMQRSWDELASEYALIADDVEVAPDLTSATFHINPAARFSNGDPITAADVKYSLETLKSPQASPLFNAQFSVIKTATVIDKQTIRFDFIRPERDAPLIAGDIPVFSPKWGMTPDGKRPSFDQIANVPPIASGPYLIEERKNDKQISYVRNPNYWAANLPSRRGMFRFARITFRLYLDQYTALEAFKAGNVDARMEYSSSQWARKYIGKNFDNGLLKKGEFPDGPAQMQGMIINMRKPMFRDVRVRHALSLAFDYDWMNRMMFYGQYRRTNSFFDASPFAATGMPSQKELALLEPFRSSLPPEVFGPMVRQPTTIPPDSLRGNLRIARDLLAQAGWHYRDGALRDPNGNPMTIEIIDDQPGMDRLLLPYMQALGMLGIQAHMREIDSALYQKQLDNFEYDMTTYIYNPVTIPGAELERRFGSAAASEIGSENYTGLKSKAVDALVHAALSANTLDDLETATRALDRVLINTYLLVPEYYLPNARIGYKVTLGFPKVVPTTYQYEDWIIDYWYKKQPGALSAASPVSSPSAAN